MTNSFEIRINFSFEFTEMRASYYFQLKSLRLCICFEQNVKTFTIKFFKFDPLSHGPNPKSRIEFQYILLVWSSIDWRRKKIASALFCGQFCDGYGSARKISKCSEKMFGEENV